VYVTFSKLSAESHKRRHILIVSVKLVAELRGQINATVGDINIGFFGVGEFVIIDVTANEIAVIILSTIEFIELKREVCCFCILRLGLIVGIAYIGAITSSDYVADKHIFTTST
jgi:hypothetical protein